MKKQIQHIGFTLVELLVVITILTILGTIASIYFFENMSQSRDATRRVDMGNMYKNIELYYAKKGEIPIPDDMVHITHSGSIAWTQGVFGEEVIKKLRNFGQEELLDPRYHVPYSYSITNTREFQIASVMENIKESENLGERVGGIFIPATHAASLVTAYVLGNYNGFLVKAGDTFIATPSIISNDISNTGALDIISGQKLVYHEFFNLPASYSGAIEELDGGFYFNVTDPIVFSENPETLKREDILIEFNERLKYIYATTPTESFEKYASVLQEGGLNKFKDYLTKYFKIQFRTYFNCADIKDDGADNGSGIYTIDPDGPGGEDAYEVYCDMSSDIGWTRRGGNHISNGNFELGTGITSEYGSNSTNTIVNLGIGNTPLLNSGYAIHQTGNSQTKYEIHLNEISLLKIGDRIDLSLWVRDDDDASSWTGNDTAGKHTPHKGYMFHNRIFYIDGTNDTNGVVQTLDTVTTADGKIWKHQKLTTYVRKDPTLFNWYIGYGAEVTRNLYFTGVEAKIFYY